MRAPKIWQRNAWGETIIKFLCFVIRHEIALNYFWWARERREGRENDKLRLSARFALITTSQADAISSIRQARTFLCWFTGNFLIEKFITSDYKSSRFGFASSFWGVEMKFFVALLLVFAFAAIEEASHFKLGGVNAFPGEFPFIVSIQHIFIGKWPPWSEY